MEAGRRFKRFGVAQHKLRSELDEEVRAEGEWGVGRPRREQVVVALATMPGCALFALKPGQTTCSSLATTFASAAVASSITDIPPASGLNAQSADKGSSILMRSF